MSDIEHLLGENLRRLRDQANLTQFELAELLDVDQSAVQKWEGATRWPRSDQLDTLCRILKVAPWRLFMPAGEQPTPGPREAIQVLEKFVTQALKPEKPSIRVASEWRAAEPLEPSIESRIPDHARELLEQISPDNKDAWELITTAALTVGKAKAPVKPKA